MNYFGMFLEQPIRKGYKNYFGMFLEGSLFKRMVLFQKQIKNLILLRRSDVSGAQGIDIQLTCFVLAI